MSLLPELLQSTSEEELNLLITQLRLSGKERDLFDFLLKNISHQDSKSIAVVEMNLSSTHFDKISTGLLKKCYTILGGEGVDLLNYLNQKLLIKHLLHEIKLLEKKNESTDNFLYLSKVFFDLIVGVPANYFDEPKAYLYGEKLIKSSTNKLSTSTYVECRILYAKLNIVRHGKPSKSFLEEINEKIIHYKELKKIYQFNSETQLWIYKTLAFFYIRIYKDSDLHIYYLKKIKNLYDEENQLPIKVKAVNECNIASHHYDCNELGKAQNCYKDVFNKYSYVLTDEVRHIARFIEINILMKDSKLAENLYKKGLKHFYNTEHKSHAIIAGLTYIKFLIHCKKYKEALVVIHKSRFLNNRNVYYKYDIELRMLENVIFALRKDYAFAQDLAFKNLKYISSQGLSIKKFLHAHYFRLLINIIYRIKEGIPLSSRALKYQKEYQQGELLIYGVLIDKIKKRAT